MNGRMSGMPGVFWRRGLRGVRIRCGWSWSGSDGETRGLRVRSVRNRGWRRGCVYRWSRRMGKGAP